MQTNLEVRVLADDGDARVPAHDFVVLATSLSRSERYNIGEAARFSALRQNFYAPSQFGTYSGSCFAIQEPLVVLVENFVAV